MIDKEVILDYVREKQEEAFIAYEEAHHHADMSGGWPSFDHNVQTAQAIYLHMVKLEEELLEDVSGNSASG
jgi:hypothetical protein